jgi:hypothetical protein
MAADTGATSRWEEIKIYNLHTPRPSHKSWVEAVYYIYIL